jgi:16S rRNA (guanine527-N7)-methyltransferase
VISLSRFRERLFDRLGSAHSSVGDGSISAQLSDHQIEQLAQYFDILRRWNRKINLTALPLDTLEDKTIDRLLVEPLNAARFLVHSSPPWVDLGSGGGSPAVPLKILVPSVPLTMVDSRARKAAFLREVAHELALPDVVVLNVRVEAMLPDSAAKFGMISVRALRMDDDLLSVTRQLLVPGGRLLLFTRGSLSVSKVGFKLLESIPLAQQEAWAVLLEAD